MTTRNEEHNKAAGVFTGIMLLLGGWGGLALAGIVLGFDYLLHGEPSERDRLEQQRADRRHDRYADALAWLEADRLDRAYARKAVRDWFTADPATRGDKPSTSESFGRALARVWNNLLVGGHRFRAGWQQGRDSARERRAAGEDRWWKPTTRPKPANREPAVPAPDDQPPPSTPGDLNGWTTKWHCPGCNRPMSAPANQPLTADDRLCPNCRTAKPTLPPTDPNEPVDAEIIPDVPEPARTIVPVGVDEPRPEAGADGYRDRLDDLRGEVDQTRNTRNEHPSPPLSALR